MRAIALTIWMTIAMSAAVTAQNATDFPVGQNWNFPDARALGLAGAGALATEGAGALMANPAALGRDAAGVTLQLSPVARSLEERRSFPVFDRFDDVSVKGIYAINNRWFAAMQGGARWAPGLEAVPFLKAVAVGAFVESDQNYRYEEEVRENVFGDALLAYNRIDMDGRIMRYAVGAAFGIVDGLDAGVQVGILSGDLAYERAVTFVDDPEDDIRSRIDYGMDNTPVVASLGATYAVTPWVTVGSHVRLPYTIDYQLASETGDAEGMASVEYPMEWHGSLEYRGRQPLLARFHLDVSYEWWSEVEAPVFPVGSAVNFGALDNRTAIRAGIEHLIFGQVPLLFGIQYRTDFQNRRNSQTLVSTGTGFRGEGWTVNASGAFSKVSYRFPDLFDDTLYGGNRSAAPTDDVDERYFFGMVTVTVELGK